MYQEYGQHHFWLDGYEGTVIEPKHPRGDGAYIWRMEFLGAFDYADRELLNRGWHLVYYKVSDQFGAPSVLPAMRMFQTYIEEQFQLKEKAVLFGFSRGGLYAVNYAAAYPEKVWKLYLDAPVLDVFSWPGGFGRGERSPKDWELCKQIYGIQEGDRDCCENPIHKIQTLIQHRIPVILVAGDADRVVPFQENGKLLYADYMLAGMSIPCIIKKGVGHHPHSLSQPDELVDWISYDPEYGAIIETGAQDWQIFQQEEGMAKVVLRGRCVDHASMERYHAFVRVVEEADGRPVVDWMRCEEDGDGWKIELNIPTGGLYRIESCMDLTEVCNEWSRRGDCIRHIGVGDVFVIAGQSNSAGYGKDMITDQQELGIHLLKNSGTWDIASHPMNDSTHTIHPENRDGANTGQSPYLSFAKYLKRILGYPIGLVQAALGGSSLKQWQCDGGELYRNLMEIMQSIQGIKGILWYQGCTEAGAGEGDTYFQRFAQMVGDIRRDAGMEDLPFFTFQLNRLMEHAQENKKYEWGKVREAQRQAAKTLPYVYVVPAVGGSMSDQIHNSASANLVLGERMAKSVLGHLYGKAISCDAPNLKSAVKKDNKTIILEFDSVSRELAWYSETAKEHIFGVEADGKEFLPQKCTIVGPASIELEFSEILPKKCRVYGAADMDLPYDLPVDSATRMPMLAFYGVLVQEKE